jgi:uncharacterized protein YndB with AHSA1/START domain
MHEFITTSSIRAPAERVWEILTNGAAYSEWNPEIVGIQGRLALGERIRVRVKIAGGAIRVAPMRVTAFEPPSRMEWTGGLPLGLFTGRRIFRVTPGDGAVEFRMLVQMSGMLAGLMVKATGDRQPEIDSFSTALKTRAENTALG